VLFFIELSTRKVEIAGIATNANGLWVIQIGRNLTDAVVDGLLIGKRYLTSPNKYSRNVESPIQMVSSSFCAEGKRSRALGVPDRRIYHKD
jgi:hypothetical protein